jgi:hypothetical protein
MFKCNKQFKVIGSASYAKNTTIFTLYQRRNIFKVIGYSLMFPVIVIICVGDFICGQDSVFTIWEWWKDIQWEELRTFNTLEDAINYKVDFCGEKEEQTYWL